MRVSKRYRESTREDDDSHSRVSDVGTGTNRLSYQVRAPIEKNEERLAMKRDFTPTSSSVSKSSRCYDENEHNMWNASLELFCHMQIGVRLETLVDEVSVEEFFLSGGPSSSAAVRVVVVHDIKEVEGERQKEVQEDKGDEERKSEVDGEVGERVTQSAHETWR